MDPVGNPFLPGAGTSPPELAGRDAVLRDASVTLQRVLLGAPGRSQVFVGLRGVGKTVLLNRIERDAADLGFETLSLEAHESKSLAALLTPPLRKLLLRLDARANWSEKTKQGIRILHSFMSTFKTSLKLAELGELELGVQPERGFADSGDLESDLPDLLVAVAEAARDRNGHICLLIDELQYLKQRELSADHIAAQARPAQPSLGHDRGRPAPDSRARRPL